MSRELNNKENKFKDLLENVEFELNTDTLWSEVSAQLPEKKNNSRKIWYFFFSGVFVTLLATFVWNLMSTTDQSKTIHTSTQVLFDQEDIVNNISTQKIPISNALQNEILNQNGNINGNINQYEDSNLNENENLGLNQNWGSNQIVNQNWYRKENQNWNGKNDIRTNEKTISDVDQSEPIVKRDVMSTLSAIGLIDMVYPIERSNNDRLKDKISIQPIQKKSWFLFLEGMAGMNQNFSRSSLQTIEEGASPLSSEIDKEGFNANLSFGLEHRSGWKFSTGLGYSTFFSAFGSTSEGSTTIEKPGTTTIIIDENGNETLVSGNINSTEFTESTFLWHRRHKRLNLRLHIGKTIFQKNAFSLGLDGGLSYNLWASDKGYYFDEDLEFQKITEDNFSPYKKRHGLGFNGAVLMEYHYENHTFGIRPFLQYNPNSITEASHRYSNTNHQLGLQASIKYFIN